MFTLIILHILFIFPFLKESTAQTSVDNRLSLAWGVSDLKRQDMVFSPFAHQDLSFLQIGIKYQRKSDFNQSIDLQLGLFSPGFKTPCIYDENGMMKTTGNDLFKYVDLDYRIGKYLLYKCKTGMEAGVVHITKVQTLNYVYGRLGNFGFYRTLGIGD